MVYCSDNEKVDTLSSQLTRAWPPACTLSHLLLPSYFACCTPKHSNPFFQCCAQHWNVALLTAEMTVDKGYKAGVRQQGCYSNTQLCGSQADLFLKDNRGCQLADKCRALCVACTSCTSQFVTLDSVHRAVCLLYFIIALVVQLVVVTTIYLHNQSLR